MVTQDKQYVVVANGKTYRFSTEDWDANKDEFMTDFPDADIAEVDKYNVEDSQDGDYISVLAGGKQYGFNKADWDANQEDFLADFPDAQMYRVRPVDYYYNQALATEAALEENAKRKEAWAATRKEGKSGASLADIYMLEAGLTPVGIMGQTDLEEAQAYIAEGKAIDEERAALQEQYDNNPRVKAAKEAWEKENGSQPSETLSERISKEYEAFLQSVPKARKRTQANSLSVVNEDVDVARAMTDIFRGKEAIEQQTQYDSTSPLFLQAIDYAKQAEEIRTAPSINDETNPFIKYLKGMGDTFSSSDFWSRGMSEMESLAKGGNAALEKFRKLNENFGENLTEELIDMNLTPAEKSYILALMDKISAEAERANQFASDDVKLSKAYTRGQGTADMFGYMADFLLSGSLTGNLSKGATKAVSKWLLKNGVSRIAKSAIKGTVGKAAAKAITKNTIKGVGKILTGVASKTAGAAVDFAARTPFSLSLSGNIADRRTSMNDKGEFHGILESTGYGIFDTAIENFSESMGGAIGDVLGVPFKAGKGAWKAMTRNVDFGNLGKAAVKAGRIAQRLAKSKAWAFLKKAGFHGPIEELGEEFIGAAVRDITIEPDAWEQMANKEAALDMVIEMAPLTAMGIAGTTGQMIHVSNQAKEKAQKLRDLLLKIGFKEKQVDYLVDYIRSTSADKLHRELLGVWNTMAKESGLGVNVTSSKVGEAVLEYAYATAQYQTLFGIKDAKEAQQRDAKRAELEEKYQGRFYGEDGMVRRHTLANGKTVFQLSGFAENGEAAAIDTMTGDHLTFTEADINDKVDKEGNVLGKESLVESLDSYLSGEVMALKSDWEQARIQRERQEQIDALSQSLPESINIGTEGEPKMLAIKGHNAQGVTVVDEDGNEGTMTWESIALKLGKPIKVLTDAQIADAEAEEIAIRSNERRAARATTDAQISDAQSNIDNTNAEIEELIPNPEEEYRDPNTGEIDQDAFWEHNPEGWADYNDRVTNDGGIDTMEQIESGLAKLNKQKAELDKMAIDSPNARKAVKAKRVELQEKIDRLTALQQKYNEMFAAAEQEAIPEEERVAENTIAMREVIEGWRNQYGVPIHVYESKAEVADAGEFGALAQIEVAETPGWSNSKGAHLFLPDIKSMEKLKETLQHEVTTHQGFKLLGEKEYGALMDKIWATMSDSAKATFYNYPSAAAIKDPVKRRRAAAEEFAALVAEKIDLGEATAEQKSIWQRIMEFFRNLFKGQEVDSQLIANAIRQNHEALKQKAAQESVDEFKAEAQDQAQENIISEEVEETAPVETITNIADAAQQDPDAIDLSDGNMYSTKTEDYLASRIREYASSKEGKKAGWNKDNIEEIIEETQDLITAIHNASTGNEFYDEFAAKDPTFRLDWRDGQTKPIVTWTRANIEYKYDMSADLLCVNNEGLEEVLSSEQMVELMRLFNPSKLDEVTTKDLKGKEHTQKIEIGFSQDDYLELYNTLKDLGFVVPCKGCFDAAGRFKMLPSVAHKFAAAVNAVIDERNADPEAFDNTLKSKAKKNATIGGLPSAASTKLDAIRAGVAGDNLTEHIKWTQLMSADGQTKMLSDWGGIFRAWQRTGAGRPKDKLLPEPYYGDIVSQQTTIIGKYGEKTPSFKDILVNTGTGLRRNSHSEFRPVLAVDEIQFMRDAFIKNLTVFKYMKELDDVRLFGKMGVKFNMSFFPEYVPGTKAAGLDLDGNYIPSEESVGAREFPYIGEDGKRHYDGKKGWQEAQKHINKDVSLSSVILSIPHLIKALTDVPTTSDKSGIWGSLIPFHSSGATSASLYLQGLGRARANGAGHGFEEALTRYGEGVTNFEAVQNDRFGKGWVIVEGKKAGEAVEDGHKLEFANGNHYYNKEMGLHLFASMYIQDSELPEGALNEDGTINLSDKEKKAIGHSYEIDYNNKVREIGTPTAYKEAVDFYLEFLPKIGLKPRFDFEVPEDVFLQMCADANVDPSHPKLGWKGTGNSWSPIDSEAYYSLFCDYGMTDPATGEWAPHNPVGYIDENGERVFRMPDNTVEIIKEGLDRYSNIRKSESAKIDEAIKEFAKRSVAKGRISQEAVDSVLGEDTNMFKTRITPEQDAAYLKAVEAGDMETAQRMVLEAAKLAMPNTKVVDEDGNPKVVYHGTGSEFYTFRETNDSNELGAGYYFSDSYEMAERYATDETLADNRFRAEALAFDIFTDEMGHSEEDYDDNEFIDDYNESYVQAVERLFGNGHVKSVFLNLENPRIMSRNSESFDPTYKYGYNHYNEGAMAKRFNDGIIDEMFEERHEGLTGTQYVAFNPSQIKSADPVTYDDNGNVIPLSERFNEEKEDIRFKTANNNQAIFVSNAAKAVEGIKMEKATPEQWLKMIEKNGGLKAGEDKWMGLSDWLKASDKKTLTKQEVLDFVNEHMIQIEEEKYGEVELSALQDEFNEIYDNIIDNVGNEDESNLQLWEVVMNPMERAWEELRDRYSGGDDFDMAFSYDSHGNIEINDPDAAGYFLGVKPINDTRLDYTTSGLQNKQEIALVIPAIEPWNERDEIHFGDAGDGRAVAWIRFGETKKLLGTTEVDGKKKFNWAKVLVIDEIQSKRHQEGREKGYRVSNIEQWLSDNNVEVVESGEFYEFIKNGETDRRFSKGLMNYDIEKAKRLYVSGYNKSDIPDAPFDKNWHELAMKRMLRYAAENGYDVIAWTTGDQQARRYDLSRDVKKISASKPTKDGERIVNIYYRDEYNDFKNLVVDKEGKVVQGDYSGNALADVIGKEMALQIMSAEDSTEFKGEGLKIGGEGMRGFYDKMLPAFMNKYGKKWGVKVEDIHLNLEGGLDMHSVPVTEEMKASVMEGQVMFKTSAANNKSPELSLPNELFLDDPIMFKVSRNNRQTISNWLNKRPDLNDEAKAEVLDYLDQFNDATLQLAVGKWYAQNAIKLPEDIEKCMQAVASAKKAKIDALKFASPMEIINEYGVIEPKAKPINPDKVSTLSKVRDLSNGISIYDVEDSEESRKNMREIINTHYGKNCSPWCILQGDENGKLTAKSQEYWRHYNGYPKQVAFKDGKLLAFSANDSEETAWWDRMDKSYSGVPVNQKIGNDKLGRTRTVEFDQESGKEIKVHDIKKVVSKDGIRREWAWRSEKEDDIVRYGMFNERAEMVEGFDRGSWNLPDFLVGLVPKNQIRFITTDDGRQMQFNYFGGLINYQSDAISFINNFYENGITGVWANGNEYRFGRNGKLLSFSDANYNSYEGKDAAPFQEQAKEVWKQVQDIRKNAKSIANEMLDSMEYDPSGNMFKTKQMSKKESNRMIDRATAFVNNTSVAVEAEKRKQREQLRIREAKELYERVLNNQFDDVTLRLIDKYIQDATPKNPYGRRISQRLPQEMERGLHEGKREAAVNALFSRISESAVPEADRASQQGKKEIETKKKELLKNWAIASGMWYENLSDVAEIADVNPIDEGTESKVYASTLDNTLVKVKRGKPFGKRFRPDIDDLVIFNHVFPNTAYTIIGYGDFGDGISTIVTQPVVNFAEDANVSVDERVSHMKSLGFEPMNKENTAFTNGKIVASDIQGKNIVKTTEDNIRVIDADMKLHTKDMGGSHVIPPVEDDILFRTESNSPAEDEFTLFSTKAPYESSKAFAQGVVDEFNAKYKRTVPTAVVYANSRQMVADGLGIPVDELSDELFKQIRQEAKSAGGANVLVARNNQDGSPITEERILIFAKDQHNKSAMIDGAMFHENIHGMVRSNPALLDLGKWLFENREGMRAKIANAIEAAYPEEKHHEEMLAGYMGYMMSVGRAQEVLDMLPEEYKPLASQIYEEFGYIPEQEDSRRSDEYRRDNARLNAERDAIQQAQDQHQGEQGRNERGELGGDVNLFKTRTAPAPTKTQDVYKLMRLGADGKLYPLFIGSAEPIELGTWYDAESPNLGDLTKLASGVHLVNNETGEAMTLDEFKAQHPEITIKGKRPNVAAINWATENGARWIEIEDKATAQRRYEGESRSYYNLGINGSGQVGQFAMRPGWHAGSLPTMRQIGKGKDKNLRDDSFVWVKGRIPADVDYQSEADANPDKDIPTHIPTDGFYMKATNANAKASQADKMGWYVAGSFIADEIISDAEARSVIDSWNAEHPDAQVEHDYPRESGREFDPARGGLVEKEGTTLFKTTAEDYAAMPVDELVEKGKMRVSAENQLAADEFMNRVRAINGNLDQLRRAASAQREYDQNTVQIITSLANDMLEGGKMSDMTNYEVKRLLGAINSATGKSDLTRSINRLMDVMIANQLRHGRDNIYNFIRIRGKKVDSRGVEVRGRLDIPGQQVMDAFRENISLSLPEIEEAIANAEDRLTSDSETIARNAEHELIGLTFAKQYVENIKMSENEEKALRKDVRDAEAEYKAGARDAKSYRDFAKVTEEAIRENRTQRVLAYQQLVDDLAKMVSGSVQGAKLLREGEKARVEQIQHYANSDLKGEAANTHKQVNNGFVNNALVQTLTSPLSTFEQWLRVFGKKSAEGKGYLYNHFMGEWNDATNQEYLGMKEANAILDAKAREVFGDIVKRWSDIFSIEKKLPTHTIQMWDDGGMKDYELTQGNLLYIYMVNKMIDGKMKLRKMGVSESDVDAIVRALDPRFVEIADWVQDEFLPSLRDKYNAVHERLFGAPMAAIDNYFPIKVNANARVRDVDLGVQESSARPSTITGSIIKRTKNSLALDVLGSNAFDVVLEHIQQMEHWAAFAEFNRDLNTLLSYRKFRNRVQNMTTIMGSGKEAWNNFRESAEIAAGVYQPKTAKADKLVTNAVKGLTAGKINFRLWTAMKQILSMPAFLPYTRVDTIVKGLVTPWESWNWAMENLPAFEKRWRSRQAGNVRLKMTEADWKLWQSEAMEFVSRIGMTPNAFVDAVTCSVGSKAVYDTQYARYRKDGYTHEKADKKAKLDATVAFNATQQSSEAAFLSAIQSDRTFIAHVLTVFRNNSFGMQRELNDALRNMKKRMTKGFKEESIEFMTKQMVRDGLTEEQAKRAAERIYRMSATKDAARIAVFGFLMQFIWALGGSAPYLLFGDDDDEKKEMLKDAAIRGAFGSIEGLGFGNVVADGMTMAITGELDKFNPSFSPAMADIANLWNKFEYDWVAGMNDLVNICAQAGLGVNPQILTDIIVAIIDACDGDMTLAKEVGVAAMRILQMPQSQIDNLKTDEIDFATDKGLEVTIHEFAKEYAEYKKMRGAGAAGLLYSDEREKEIEEKYIKRFLKHAEELKRSRGNEEAKKYYEYLDTEYKEVTGTLNDLKRKAKEEGMKGNMVGSMEFAKMLDDYMKTDTFNRYVEFGGKAGAIERLRDKIMKVDPKTRETIEEAMLDLRREMVEEMEKASN